MPTLMLEHMTPVSQFIDSPTWLGWLTSESPKLVFLCLCHLLSKLVHFHTGCNLPSICQTSFPEVVVSGHLLPLCKGRKIHLLRTCKTLLLYCQTSSSASLCMAVQASINSQKLSHTSLGPYSFLLSCLLINSPMAQVNHRRCLFLP